MSKKLIISIDSNGFVSAEVSGAKGKKCMEYISLLEEILEGKAVSEEFTQEYYQQQSTLDVEQNIQNKI